MKKYIISIILLSSVLGINLNYSFAEEIVIAEQEEVTEEVKQLKLNGAEVLGKNEIELEFGSKIDPNGNNDISVRNAGDDPKEIYVDNYTVKEEKVLITLEEDLESNTEYEIIIFSIMGKNGSTITSGLDGALKFTSPDLAIFDLPSAGEKVEEKVEEVEEVKEKNENLAGKDISKEEISKKIEVVAGEKEELAKTGPEHVLLAILALVLSGLIGYTFNQRKNNKI